MNVWRMRVDLHLASLAYVQYCTALAHSYTSAADRAEASVLSGDQCEVEEESVTTLYDVDIKNVKWLTQPS